MAIWSILQPFGILYICAFGMFGVIWYIFPHFGILYKEKSGNPASHSLHFNADAFESKVD
jgi:hypothetical protein